MFVDRAGTKTEVTISSSGPRRSKVRRLEDWLLSRPQSTRRLTLMVYWAAIYFMTHWPRVEDFPSMRWLPHADKVVHFCFYGGWAALWCWVLVGRGTSVSRRAVAWLVLGGMIYAVFDELTQAIVGRDPEVGDFLGDTCGVVVMLLLLAWYSRRRWRRGRGGREQASPGMGAG